MKEEPKTRNRGRPRTRFQPDVRLTVRFCPGRDDDLLAWLEKLPGASRMYPGDVEAEPERRLSGTGRERVTIAFRLHKMRRR